MGKISNLFTDIGCFLELSIEKITKTPKAILLTAKGNGIVVRRRRKGKRVLFSLFSFIRF